MTEANYVPSSADLVAILQARAASDQDFRAELLANPRAAFEKLFGTELPAHIKLQAIDQPADTYIVPVPQVLAAAPDGELSDNDLEAVAGGSKAGAKKFFNGIGGKATRTASMMGGTFQRMGETVAHTASGHAGKPAGGIQNVC